LCGPGRRAHGRGAGRSGPAARPVGRVPVAVSQSLRRLRLRLRAPPGRRRPDRRCGARRHPPRFDPARRRGRPLPLRRLRRRIRRATRWWRLRRGRPRRRAAFLNPVTDPARPDDGPGAALRDTLVVGFGLFPLGLAFGLLLTQSGFAWWWAPLFSLLIYAGSLEFLAIGLLLALTPLAQLAVTTLMVNSRHVFYALSFPLHRVRGPWAKTYAMYALTD